MGTALVYHEDMTAARLLWDDPECEIERPERLTTTLKCLRERGLEQRCLRVAAREASEAELALVHSPEYVALMRGTQTLDTRELQALSGQYDAVYLHPATFHCARLAAGAALQLVDAVLTGAVRNGLALVRPPGHHSQQAAANGFCVFNNVAIAARHAMQNRGVRRCVPGLRGPGRPWEERDHTGRGGATTDGAEPPQMGRSLPEGPAPAHPLGSRPLTCPAAVCHRVLIVDWDIHHGQGIQYTFEDDPSVLYFSWHRYEYGHFWPHLRDSDADAVGRGPGLGFTVNLPWNQVGLGNADYVAAFLHVLLPLAFEFDPELVLISAGFDSAIGDPEMCATPECFAHLTQLLQTLAGGRVCAVLEGGYHLEALAHSVCMTLQALLGDPAPPLSGAMEPHQSALESIQSVRAAQAPHWTSVQAPGQCGSARLEDSDCPLDPAPLLGPSPGSPVLPGDPEVKATLSSLLDQLCLHPPPPVRVAVVLATSAATLDLPPDVLPQEGSATQEETQAWARPHAVLAQEEALSTLGKVLYLLDGVLAAQVSSGLAAIPSPVVAATLDVALRHSLARGAQRLLCVTGGQLDWSLDLADDRRALWLHIGAEEAAALSMFRIATPLPGTTGGFLSCLLALVLPLAYSFQPDLVLVVLGPAHSLKAPQAALLAALLRGPAGGRVVVLVEEESTAQLAGVLARVLRGDSAPSLGPFSAASPEDMQALVCLRRQLEPQWKILQVAGSPLRGPVGR
ncbi:polyamine deacetylase HDAC10 isoform X4 [Sorex araneus]|uniref:polyamine deacetylase HDAC10 isoform X4 n=1 Tax=Sorex araneus TaxID=42254 RepID=UPI002433EE2E|nr:polyamine deacetylase HDAC10 isoform X4 [Sorex araneus]